MSVHDWTRVTAGTFHAFHNAWITHLQEALNAGRLPEGYYALGEQASGDIGPDLLTLHSTGDGPEVLPASSFAEDDAGMIAVAEHPPQVSIAAEAGPEAAYYLARRRSLVIRHVSGDRIVALVEIVSPGNKHSQRSITAFLDKVLAALNDGYHLLIVDLFPPGRFDPAGVHALIWECLTDEPYEPQPDRPLTLASYCAKTSVTCYVEPTAVGRRLVEMPLFLTVGHYINVPLEGTYMDAWRGVPERWKRVIEGGGKAG
jgi:hypothetical protein